MLREKKCEECKPPAAIWVTTFSDMCSLLLTFFILLISMATFEPAKFTVAARSLQGAFGVMQSYPTVLIAKYVQMPKLGGNEERRKLAAKTVKQIEKIAKQEGLESAVKVQVTEEGIAVKIADPVGFELGKSDIRQKIRPLLTGISGIIQKMPEANIRVEGHTDNLPIQNNDFPSNWELSASRALNVVKFMAFECGVAPARLSGVGYGEYRPVAPNDSDERRALNRRIEIYVEFLKKTDNKEDRGE